MEMLTREQIINSISEVKNGTYVRIGYRSELPVKAELKRKGVKAYKYTETTVRVGVNYGKIASVIARKAEEKLETAVTRTNNYEWVIQNKVRYNTNTCKDYLYVADINGKAHNTKSVFVVIPESGCELSCEKDIFEQEFKDYLIPSYWTKQSGSYSEVRNIAFENVFRVGTTGKGQMLSIV